MIFCCALAFGGIAQLIAGFQEFKCGNNFGYSAFVTYGAFWIALAGIFLVMDLQAAQGTWVSHLKITGTDVGYFLLAFTVYTVFMFIGSFAIHFAMFLTFLTLLLGFIGLDLVFLAGMKSILTITAIDLVVCALLALDIIAHVVLLQHFGRDVLPVGSPLVPKPKLVAKPA